jgi:hypothetical protein
MERSTQPSWFSVIQNPNLQAKRWQVFHTTMGGIHGLFAWLRTDEVDLLVEINTIS